MNSFRPKGNKKNWAEELRRAGKSANHVIDSETNVKLLENVDPEQDVRILQHFMIKIEKAS